MSELLIEQRRDVTVVDFRNASVLDSHLTEHLSSSLLELVQREGHRKLVLDFSQVQFVGSQALILLLKLKKLLDSVSGKMIIASLRPDPQNVLRVTSLLKVFTVREALAPAVAELSETSEESTIAEPEKLAEGNEGR